MCFVWYKQNWKLLTFFDDVSLIKRRIAVIVRGLYAFFEMSWRLDSVINGRALFEWIVDWMVGLIRGINSVRKMQKRATSFLV